MRWPLRFLWGIGAACAFAFDVGVFGAYLLAAANLYRLNAPDAGSPPRAVHDQERTNNLWSRRADAGTTEWSRGARRLVRCTRLRRAAHAERQ